MSYDPGAPGPQPPGGQPPGGQPFGGQSWSGGQQPYPSGYGQQPPPSWGPPTAAAPNPPPPQRSALTALFDYSFTSFATPGMVRLLYIVGTVLIALAYVSYVVVSFNFSSVVGIITLLVGAVVALFSLALLRVSLEFYYAVVRMSEDIHHRR